MAGQVDSKEIIVGAASLYLNEAPNPNGDNTTEANSANGKKPAFVSSQSFRDTLASDTAWRNVGYTMEGLELAYEPDYGEVEVDQLLDSAFLFKQSQKVSLNTTFAQATLVNLLVAWGQSANTLDSTGKVLDIDGGSLGAAPVERSIIAVGNGPRTLNNAQNANNYSERVYHAYRILQVEQTTLGAKRSEASGVPVSFRALPATTGKYGQVIERARTW